MNNITAKQIKLLIAALAGLFFACSTASHIFGKGWGSAMFVTTLILIVIILTVIMLLFEKLTKIDRDENHRLTKEFENERNELVEQFNKLQNRIITLEKQENIRTGNLLKETKLKNLVNSFVNKSSNSSKLLSYLVKTFRGVAAIFYIRAEPNGSFAVHETFGLPEGFAPASFAPGEGCNGQAAADCRAIAVNSIPNDYFEIFSGLGSATPEHIYLLPVVSSEQCVALIELATFEKNDLEEIWEKVLDKTA